MSITKIPLTDFEKQQKNQEEGTFKVMREAILRSVPKETGGYPLGEPADPLRTGVVLGKIWKVKDLINAGANLLTIYEDDATLLHVAALNGRLEMVRFLVAQNLPLLAKTTTGKTPKELVLWHLEKKRKGEGPEFNLVQDEVYEQIIDFLNEAEAKIAKKV